MKNCRLGPGVYFTSDPAGARTAAIQRYGVDKAGVFRCEVDLGDVKNLYDDESDVGTWQRAVDEHGRRKYDSCYAKHPLWVGTKLREFCVLDVSKIKILGWTDA